MAGQQRKHLDVETDPVKLCNYLVGGNILKVHFAVSNLMQKLSLRRAQIKICKLARTRHLVCDEMVGMAGIHPRILKRTVWVTITETHVCIFWCAKRLLLIDLFSAH